MRTETGLSNEVKVYFVTYFIFAERFPAEVFYCLISQLWLWSGTGTQSKNAFKGTALQLKSTQWENEQWRENSPWTALNGTGSFRAAEERS